MEKDTDIHSFIVKVWLASGEDKNSLVQLQGRITHAYTKEFSPVHTPSDILAFVKPYLQEMNVKLSLRNRLILWLCS